MDPDDHSWVADIVCCLTALFITVSFIIVLGTLGLGY